MLGSPGLKRNRFTGNKEDPQGLLSAPTFHITAPGEVHLPTVSDLPPNPVRPGTEDEEVNENTELDLAYNCQPDAAAGL